MHLPTYDSLQLQEIWFDSICYALYMFVLLQPSVLVVIMPSTQLNIEKQAF